MPQIGSVFIPDQALQNIAAQSTPAPARPGFFSTLGAQAENTAAQLRYGLPFAIGQATGQLTDQDRAGYTQKLQEAAKAVAPYQPATVGDVFSGRRGLGDFLSSNAAALIPQAAGMVAGGAIGGAALGPGGAIGGAILAGTPGFVGQNVQSAVESTGGLSEAQAKRSLLIAPFQAGAAEAAGYVTPGLGRFLGSAGDAYTGSLGMRIGKSMLATGAAQAGAGAAMEAGTQFASGDLGYNPDSAGKIADAAIGGFAIGGLLGTFGGFKRAKVDTDPVPQPDDMVDQTNKIIAGEATTKPPAPLQLPSPQMFGREPGGPVDINGNPIAIDTTGTAYNPSPIGPSGELQGLYARNNRPGEPPAGPALPVPGDVQARIADLFQQSRPEAPEAPLGSQASLRGLLGFSDPNAPELPAAPEAPPAAPEAAAPAEPGAPRAEPLLADADKPLIQLPDVAHLEPDQERPLAPFPLADLDRAAKSKAAEPDLADHVSRERSLRQAELLGSVPTDDATFQSRLTEAKEGLRGQFIEKLDATDPQDLVSKVMNEVFETGTKSASTQKLAQRLGILDDNLNPMPWVKTALKAKDDAEQAQIKAERDARKAEAAAKKNASKAPEPAPPEPQKTAAPEPAKAAQPAPSAEPPNKPIVQGSLDADPATRLRTMIDALRSSENGKATIRGSEANELHDLVDAKKFDEAHKRIGEILAAKEDGTVAPAPKDPVLSARRERLKQIAEAAEKLKGDRTKAEEQALPIDKEADLAENTREEERVKAVEAERTARAETEAPNNPVDNSELPEQRPAEPEATIPNEPIKQAKLPKTQKEAEAQRAEKAAAKAEKPAKAAKPEKAAEPAPKFDEDRAPALRDRIEKLRQAVPGTSFKGIGDAVAQAAHDMVDRGKYDEVAKTLEPLETNRERAAAQAERPALTEDKQPPVREDRPGSGTPDKKLGDAINGKTVGEAAKYLADNAPSRYHRALFDAVSKLATRLEGPKWTSKVNVVKNGDMVPGRVASIMNNERTGGYAHRETDASGTRNLSVWLHDQSRGGDFIGANYLTTGHELLHAVMMDAIDLGMRGRSGDARLNTLMKDLRDVHNAVIKHYNARVAEMKAGKIQLSPIEEAYFNNRNNALADPHEVMSWGLTHPGMQEYLQSVPYKAKTNAFMGLIGSMRKLLGLDKMARADTALTELVRIADDALRPDKQQLSGYSLSTYQEGKAAVDGPPEKTETAVNGAFKSLTDAVEKIDLANLGGVWNKTKQTTMGWMSSNHLARLFGDKVAGVNDLISAHRDRVTIRNFLQRMGSQAFVKFEQLPGETQGRIRDIMGMATEFGLDPTKTLDQHTWLTDKALAATGVSRDRITELHTRITNEYNTLRRQGEGDAKGAGAAAYHEFADLNRMQALQNIAQSFHAMVARDENLQNTPLGKAESPAESFIRTVQTSDTAAGLKYWQDTVSAQ